MKSIFEWIRQNKIPFIGCAILLVLMIPVLCIVSCSHPETSPTTESSGITEQTTEASAATVESTCLTEPTTVATTEDTTEQTDLQHTVSQEQDPQKPSSGNSGTKVDVSPELTDDIQHSGTLSFGIDVSRYQGTIDWEKVAQSGTEFAMIRVGYRTLISGEIVADSNALYNLQQASKHGIKLGVYFFSTAISTQEAIQEANWVSDFIAQYPITYPVAYNCEGFQDPENRQYSLSKAQRTDIALAFLKTIKSHGYTAMFYGSQSDLLTQWEVSRLDSAYKVWVAQYPTQPYPETERSTYSGKHAMWQYSCNGVIPGISKNVDVNIAYFSYDKAEDPKNNATPEDAEADVEALMSFTKVNESVTAKEKTNLRSHPSQGAESTVLYALKNGQIATRIGISSSGWSKLEYNGKICYAVSSYLTTDLTAKPDSETPTEPDSNSQIQTQFTAVDEQVTAKELVNLRSLPSTTHADSVVLAQLKKGEVAKRIGISTNGWSKLEYNGSICYAISSYLTTDIDGTGEEADSQQITTQFTPVNEQVTAKDAVNLRTMPSTTNENSVVIVQLQHGQVVTRTGINTDVGWSRVVYEGQVLYCISSYLQSVEETTEPSAE